MKVFFITFILIFITGFLNAQLIIDAGNDTTICIDLYGVDTTQTGGNPTATGGVEPYEYAWSANYSVGSNTYGASTFLDDTTKANPKIIDAPVGNDITFRLKVTDNNGAEGFDSVYVRYSQFAFIAEDCRATISDDDTTVLYNGIGGGIKPLSYAWNPNYNISDTSLANPMAWPDTSVNYKVYAIDAVGCKSLIRICTVTINPVDIQLSAIEKFLSNVYPNPIDESSIISLQTNIKSEFNIQVLNAKGQTIWTDNFYNNTYEIGKVIHSKGLFRYLIFDGRDVISYGQFINQ